MLASLAVVITVVIAALAILSIPGGHGGRIVLNGDQELLEEADRNGWSGVGTVHDPLIIEGLELNVSDGGPCFFLSNIRLHLVVRECVMTCIDPNVAGQGVAMRLDNVTNITVQGCVISGGEVGLELLASDHLSIRDMEIHGGVHGLRMVASECNVFSNVRITGALNASNCLQNHLSNVTMDGMGANELRECYGNSFVRTVFNATEGPGLRLVECRDNHFDLCTFNGRPLGAGGSRGMFGLVLINAHECEITNCSMLGGGYMGIGVSIIRSNMNEVRDCHLLGYIAVYLIEANDVVISDNNLEGSVVGIDMDGCEGCIISKNSMDSDFSVTGLQMFGGSSNSVIGNVLSTHSVTGFAVFLNGSSGNTILGNSFQYLGEGDRSRVLGMDDTGGNAWNDSMGGNHWSDLTSPDQDEDGIIDTPYLLEGGSGATDNRPLVSPPSPC